MIITEIDAYNKVYEIGKQFTKKYNTSRCGCGYKFSILDVTDFEWSIEYCVDECIWVNLHYISACGSYYLTINILDGTKLVNKVDELPLANNMYVDEMLKFVETITDKLDF